MYPAVLFDLDGTLLNTLLDLAAAGNHALALLGLPPRPTEDYKQLVGNGIRNLVRGMLPESHRSEETIEQANQHFDQYYDQHLTDQTCPYPGILDMLKHLQSAGIQMAVLSNKPNDYTQDIVRHYFGDLFCAIYGLLPNYNPKPDPALVQMLLKEQNINASTCLYCGDSNVDMLLAQNANLASCGVAWGFRGKEELQKTGAQYIAEIPDDITKIVLG